jgi:hypothetical protein
VQNTRDLLLSRLLPVTSGFHADAAEHRLDEEQRHRGGTEHVNLQNWKGSLDQ